MPRILDLFLTAVASIILLPLAAIAAGVNWLTGGGVLFRQVRVGRGLRPFTIMKLQTMFADSERVSTITTAGDARITPVGRFLRALKLDEVPQLLNVWRGEMSLVGPRALTPNEVARIPADSAARVYSLRPGITGAASLLLTDEERLLAAVPDPESYYYQVLLPQKVSIELLYVQRKSFWVDAAILALTPFAVAAPRFIRAVLLRVLGGRLSS